MNVVSFHSYKGGVGRTLLAVYLADLLARMGKRVGIVDLDFRAPGVASKLQRLPGLFGNGPSQAPYQLSEIQFEYGGANGKDLHSLVVDLGSRSGPNLKDFAEQVVLKELVRVPTAAKNSGCICYVLTKPKENLPSAVPSEELRAAFDAFAHAHGFEGALGLSTYYPPAKLFRNHLRALIEKKFALDYLFFDCAAGHNSTAHYVTGMLAQTVVCPFTGSAESAMGMDAHLASIGKSAREHEHLPTKFRTAIPVLTRVQAPLLEALDPRIQGRVNETDDLVAGLVSRYGKDLKFKTIPRVNEDPCLEADEFYRLCLNPSEFQFAPLHQSLIELARACFPEISEQDCHKAFTGDPRKPAITSNHNLMWLNPETGELKNPRDLKSNISLRVTTLVSILEGIQAHYLAMDSKSSNRKVSFDEMLISGGEHGGRNFGNQLGRIFGAMEARQGRSLSIRERVDFICEWDAHMGFGRPRYDDATKTITLIPPDGTGSDITVFAKLMEGYFRGVLENLGLAVGLAPKQLSAAIVFAVRAR